MKSESLKITGKFILTLRDKNGVVKDERVVKNTIVTAGKNFLANWLIQATQSGSFMSWLALGSGTTGALITDTTLETEFTGGSNVRVAGTLSAPGATNIWQNQGVFAAGNGTGAVTEAGVLSASSAGTLLARQTFAVINKGASDSLTVTWQVTIG